MKPFIIALLTCGVGLSMQSHALSFSKDYEGCMRKANSHSESIRLCQISELKVQNKRLKKTYKQTIKKADVLDRALIKQTRTQWYQQRVNACQLSGKKMKRYSTMNASCALQITVSHADMLEVRLNNASSK